MEEYEVRAEVRFTWEAPQKVRLVVNRVRGMATEEAMGLLKLMPQKAAKPVFKLVKAAVANAENNYGMAKVDLYIASISADEGPMRHWRRFGARGRFKPILKRSSHITVILRERETTEV